MPEEATVEPAAIVHPDVPTVVPVDSRPPPPVKPKVKPPPPPSAMVRLRNLSDQMIECSVLSEDGQRASVRLMARGVSIPYPESQIDQYTRNLADRGVLKIEPSR